MTELRQPEQQGRGFWYNLMNRKVDRRKALTIGVGEVVLVTTGLSLILRQKSSDVGTISQAAPTPDLLHIDTLEEFIEISERQSQQFEVNFASKAYEETRILGEIPGASMQDAAFTSVVHPGKPILLLPREQQDVLKGTILSNLFEIQKGTSTVTYTAALNRVLQIATREVAIDLVYSPRFIAWALSIIPHPPYIAHEIFPKETDIPTGSANIYLQQIAQIAETGTHLKQENTQEITTLRESIIDAYTSLLQLSLLTIEGQTIYNRAFEFDGEFSLPQLTIINSPNLTRRLAEFYFYASSGSYMDTIRSDSMFSFDDITKGRQLLYAQEMFTDLNEHDLHIALFLNANYALLESSMMAMGYSPYLFLTNVLEFLFYVARHESPNLSLMGSSSDTNLSYMPEKINNRLLSEEQASRMLTQLGAYRKARAAANY